MRIAFLLMVLFISGCIATAGANGVKDGIDNSPGTRAKYNQKCVECCNKQHYPNVMVIDRGWRSVKKIHVILEERTVCVCYFNKK